MGVYDFDTVVDRKGTNCLKYDFAVRRGYPPDVLPLWVADMDFPTAPQILEALHKAVSHGIFGYSETQEAYYQTVAGWFRKHYHWETEYRWLIKTPGVVFALAMAIKAYTEPGESVLIQTPVYYPFYDVIRDNDRNLVQNELVYKNGRYEIDFDDFETKVKKQKVKLFILCSPHNPVGRVWTIPELQRIGAICKKYNVIVVSDEIHCDFAFPEHPHTIFLQACPDMQDSTVICTSPSKSFNLAGLQMSNNFIPNRDLWRKFKKQIHAVGYTEFNALGIVAAQTAYESGGDWLIQCKAYLRKNLDFLRNFLNERLPEIRLVEPEGTYFAWLDCSGLGLTPEALDYLVIHKAGLWLDAGHVFGRKSEQFQRIVLACPRKTLETALIQLEQAIRQKETSYEKSIGKSGNSQKVYKRQKELLT